MQPLIFSQWSTLTHTLIVGVLAYFCVILILRITGKRTLSKMNAFDFIVTIALGSTLSSTVLDSSISVVHGTLAFITLAGLQYLLTWTSVRQPWVKRMVTGEPSMVVYQGEFLEHSLRKERVTRDEVQSVLRSAGLSAVEQAEAVILETDGSFSVLPRKP